MPTPKFIKIEYVPGYNPTYVVLAKRDNDGKLYGAGTSIYPTKVDADIEELEKCFPNYIFTEVDR